MGPGIFQWCEEIEQREMGKIATQEIPCKHKEELIYCENDGELEHSAQRGFVISFSREI